MKIYKKRENGATTYSLHIQGVKVFETCSTRISYGRNAANTGGKKGIYGFRNWCSNLGHDVSNAEIISI